MILRLTDNAKHIVHVPKLLYYWRSHAGQCGRAISRQSLTWSKRREARLRIILRQTRLQKLYRLRALARLRRFLESVMRFIGEPKISIIIPNKDHVEDLRRCISSIVEKSTWENYEIIVVENNSETKEIFAYYDELQNNPQIRVVTFEGKFNYSKINNFGVISCDRRLCAVVKQ